MSGLRRSVVLRVGNMFEPAHMVAIEVLLQREMHHSAIGCGAMPVLFSGRNPYGIAGTDLARGLAPECDPADAGHHMQSLTERMRMPGGTRTRLEFDPCSADSRRSRRFDDRLLPYGPGEPVCRHAARWHRPQRFKLHADLPCARAFVRAVFPSTNPPRLEATPLLHACGVIDQALRPVDH